MDTRTEIVDDLCTIKLDFIKKTIKCLKLFIIEC